MIEGWVWWILTTFAAFYFIILLLEFNKPQRKLEEQIDAQGAQYKDMRGRLITGATRGGGNELPHAGI